MKQLVDEDARKLGAGAIERDAAMAQKRRRMHRPVAVAETGNAIEPDWLATKVGETARDDQGAAVNRRDVGGEERRHSDQSTAALSRQNEVNQPHPQPRIAWA